MPTREFWSTQRVFLTGHTGFKGSWTSLWLSKLGATQTGFALAPSSEPSLFPLLKIRGLTSVIGDIRETVPLTEVIRACDPTVAIHMAAQPLVRTSYREPAETYATNVMGTVNVLEAIRHHAPSIKAVLVITTDKVYANDDSGRAFVETDRLGGHDPYSSSKAACEEVVSSYRQSFYDDLGIPLATARAGNVIGGGDWSLDRLIPDIWRAMNRGEAVVLRNPNSIRPWQHVLDPVSGYLDYVEAMTTSRWATLPRALNFAPAADSPMTVREVTEVLAEAMGIERGWQLAGGVQPTEMRVLTLDASLARRTLGWAPLMTGREAVGWTAEWIHATREGTPAHDVIDAQIDRYEQDRHQSPAGAS